MTTPEDSILLSQATKQITDLKKEIQKLTDKLRTKESLLSGFINVAAGQSKRLAAFTSSLQDTVAWDPSKCSTPQSSWSVVQIRGQPMQTVEMRGSPILDLFNRSTPLDKEDPPAPVTSSRDVDFPDQAIHRPGTNADPRASGPPPAPSRRLAVAPSPAPAPFQARAPTPLHAPLQASAPAPFRAPAPTPLQAPAPTPPQALAQLQPPAPASSRADGLAAGDHLPSAPPSAVQPMPLSLTTRAYRQPAAGDVSSSSASVGGGSSGAAAECRRQGASSARRRLLKEAVIGRSGVHPGPLSAEEDPMSRSEPCPHRGPQSRGSGSVHPPANSSPPPPLFPPSTLIIGDSIIKKVRYFNAITHSLPGATITVIIKKLLNILPSLPISINRIIVHVGTNDVAQLLSEQVKALFTELINFLKRCGRSVFISGPTPPFRRGDMRFSRVFGLCTWLRSTCRAHGVEFIDNFDLFWERPSFYHHDGIHPSSVGTFKLAENIKSAVKLAALSTPQRAGDSSAHA